MKNTRMRMNTKKRTITNTRKRGGGGSSLGVASRGDEKY
jgi:hypothetical protein